MLVSLGKTRQAIFGKIATIFGATELTESNWDEIEMLLIQADTGAATAQKIVGLVRSAVSHDGITTQADLKVALRTALLGQLGNNTPFNLDRANPLSVVMLVGVNGSGKTTTVAKLAHRFGQDGWRLIIAAADTFRAAAIEQLQFWGEQLGVPVIAGQTGSDPGAVVYDAIQASGARNRNMLIVDTAGRLHTKFNLMEELRKVQSVVTRHVPGAPHEVLLVLDGTTGQNALTQADQFRQAVGVSGAILTKLDGTSRGGIVFAIEQRIGIPIRYLGIGEGLDDFVEFDENAFVNSLLAEDST